MHQILQLSQYVLTLSLPPGIGERIKVLVVGGIMCEQLLITNMTVNAHPHPLIPALAILIALDPHYPSVVALYYIKFCIFLGQFYLC